MTEFKISDLTEEEYDLPKYSDKGRILVRILSIDESTNALYRYELDVLDYDHDSSVFWIYEGVDFEFWFDQYCCDIEELGVYVVEGVCGEYIRGEWGFTDDDEEWEFESIRLATEEEIKTETLS